MCNNWKWGDRKSDMTLAQLEPVLDSPFWGAVENLNISGGEPTTRIDLPEMVEMFQRHLPRLRKIGINTTGLTPHRAIPMLTRIVKFCAEKDLLISIRVSLDGIGDIHNQVRARQERLRQGVRRRSRRCRRSPKEYPNFQFGIASTIFATNLEDAREHPDLGARPRSSTSSSTCCASPTRCCTTSELEGDDRLPRARRRRSCGSSSSIASRKNRC